MFAPFGSLTTNPAAPKARTPFSGTAAQAPELRICATNPAAQNGRHSHLRDRLTGYKLDLPVGCGLVFNCTAHVFNISTGYDAHR